MKCGCPVPKSGCSGQVGELGAVSNLKGTANNLLESKTLLAQRFAGCKFKATPGILDFKM